VSLEPSQLTINAHSTQKAVLKLTPPQLPFSVFVVPIDDTLRAGLGNTPLSEEIVHRFGLQYFKFETSLITKKHEFSVRSMNTLSFPPLHQS
jgi:hypothetical protein